MSSMSVMSMSDLGPFVELFQLLFPEIRGESVGELVPEGM